MKKLINFLRSCLVGMVSALSLIACNGGGGGGGGSGGGGPAPAVYMGLTTQATVTSSNGSVLAGGAVLSGATGASASVTAVQSSGQTEPVKARSVVTAKTLKNSLGRIDFRPTGDAVARAIVSDSGTIPGTCTTNPGSVSYTINLDDVTGNFSGSLAYNSYCDQGDVLSGNAGFSGNVNVNLFPSVFFTSIIISPSALSIVSGSDRFTISGDISDTNINYAGTTVTTEKYTMTMNLRNDSNGVVARIQDFTFTFNYDFPSFGTDSVTNITGRYYWPTEGYVDIASTSDFQYGAADDYPRAGVVVATGVVVPGGSSAGKAQLTANNDAMTYSIKVDADGDGTFEYSAIYNKWADL